MAKIIVSIVVGSILAWVFGFNITEVLIAKDSPTGELDLARKRQDVNRGHAYALCALIVFACSVPIALNLPLFPELFGAFDKIFYTFPVIFIPAWFGVLCALPRRPKD